MATTQASQFVSVESYLNDPRYEKAEYVEGQIVEREVGNKPHGKAQLRCGSALLAYCDAMGIGTAYSEIRCKLRGGPWPVFRQPDVCVVIGAEGEEPRFLDGAPDLAVEIRSPGDSVASLLRKAHEYLAAGAKQVWLLSPEEKSVLILSPDQTLTTLTEGDTLDGGSLLPGFSIAVAKLFQ